MWILQYKQFAINVKYFLIRDIQYAYCTDSQLLLINRLQKIVTIFKKFSLKFSIFDFKNFFTLSVKYFVRRAYFCFFKQTFERKKFSTRNKKFPANIKEQKTFDKRNFHATGKQGLKLQKVAQRLGALPPDP